MFFVNQLTDKWGDFIILDHYKEQVKLPFISDKARLNVLFDPLPDNVITDIFERKLHSGILPELASFYKSFNGCRLFSSSLNIYGIQAYHDDVYEPFDLVRENFNHYSMLSEMASDMNLVLFGSIGGDYRVGYDRDEMSGVYIFKVGATRILKTYNGFEQFFMSYFNYLIDEYDLAGKKIHVLDKYKDIPVLANVSGQLI